METFLYPHICCLARAQYHFFTLCTCSPVKMWQIAEFKCSETWSETAVPNHLHKEGFWSFGFSSHLPGILYFLHPDQVAGNVRGLWYMGIIFRASPGSPSLTATARFLIWWNFQKLCSLWSKHRSHGEIQTIFSSCLSSQRQFTLKNWIRFYASLLYTNHRKHWAESSLWWTHSFPSLSNCTLSITPWGHPSLQMY